MAKKRPPTAKGELARSYLQRFPTTASRQLARKMVAEHPEVFATVEAALGRLCYYRGKNGKKNRRELSEDTSLVDLVQESTYKARWALKKSRGRKRSVFQIPAKHDRVLWISDIHFPNHDEKALTVALEYGLAEGANCVVIGGDLLDNSPFTRFRSKPSDRYAAREYFEMATDFLTALRLNFPEALILYMEGNHDRWYSDWLIDHCAVVFDDPYYQLETRLGLEALRIPYLGEHVMVKAGKLPLLHGHTIIRGVFAPVNPARGAYLRSKHNLLIGHCHQVSVHSEKDLQGKPTKTWSTGCLCTIPPAYDPHNTKQTHGFAFITTSPSGDFTVRNLEIIDGRIR